jgi:starch-binding outer membrane protein, SusD/RagB family
MKKVIYILIATGMLLFTGTSCEDVLDKQSVDSFNQEVVFADVNIVKAYLGKCYDRMGGNTNNGILGMREDLLASGTDQTLCIHRPANYVHLKNTLSPDQLGYFNNEGMAGFLRWNSVYANIQNVNNIIVNIDAVPESTPADGPLKKRLKGEAHFIRAYMYSMIMMNYGGAILNDAPFQLGQEFLTITRSTLAQTRDFIIADVAKAIENLPATGMEQGRANQAAAAALKSRVLLFSASELVNGGYEATTHLYHLQQVQGQSALLQHAMLPRLSWMAHTAPSHWLVRLPTRFFRYRMHR